MVAKSSLISGMGVAMSLVQGLVDAVRAAGGSDDDLHRLVTDEGKLTLDEVAEVIVGVVRRTFDVMVDYSRPLVEMVSSGNYARVSRSITRQNFPMTSLGRHNQKITLLHFNRVVGPNDAIKEMASAGYQPAKLEELLALCEAQQGLGLQFPIIALASVWKESVNRRYVPFLSSYSRATRRWLNLHRLDGPWNRYCRFAAVRKAS